MKLRVFFVAILVLTNVHNVTAAPSFKPIDLSWKKLPKAIQQILPKRTGFVSITDDGRLISELYYKDDGCRVLRTDRAGLVIEEFSFGSFESYHCDDNYELNLVTGPNGWIALVDTTRDSTAVTVNFISPSGERTTQLYDTSELNFDEQIGPYTSGSPFSIDTDGTLYGLQLEYQDVTSSEWIIKYLSVSAATGFMEHQLIFDPTYPNVVTSRTGPFVLVREGQSYRRYHENSEEIRTFAIKSKVMSKLTTLVNPNNPKISDYNLNMNLTGDIVGRAFSAYGSDEVFLVTNKGRATSLDCQLPARLGELEYPYAINSKREILVRSTNKSGDPYNLLLIPKGKPAKNYCTNFTVKVTGQCDRYFDNHPDELVQTHLFPLGKAPTCTFEAMLKDHAGKPLSGKEIVLTAGSYDSTEVKVSTKTDSKGRATLKYPVTINEAYTWVVRFWRDSEYHGARTPLQLKVP